MSGFSHDPERAVSRTGQRPHLHCGSGFGRIIDDKTIFQPLEKSCRSCYPVKNLPSVSGLMVSPDGARPLGHFRLGRLSGVIIGNNENSGPFLLVRIEAGFLSGLGGGAVSGYMGDMNFAYKAFAAAIVGGCASVT
jgi:hypothetical protein